MKKVFYIIFFIALSCNVFAVDYIAYSTSIVKKGSPQKQIGMIEIKNFSMESIDLKVIFPNYVVEKKYENLNASIHAVSFEFPVIQEATEVKIQIFSNGKCIHEETNEFFPPKQWTIYDVQVSHHDLGYADYYHMMRRDVREMGIEMALEFARKTDNWPKESQFHWTVETSEPMIRYISRQPKEVIDELVYRIKKGQIALGGIHNSVYTEHMGFETMARLFYTPNRYVCDWLGILPSKTAFDDDVVGFTRALATYSKEANIPYFMFGRNSSIKEFDVAEDYPAFYWQAPDRDSRATLYKIWHYYSPDRLMKYDLMEISALCRRYEADVNYPYSCLLSEDSYDFGMPEFENVEGIYNWNKTYANPVLVSGTFDMYFDDLSSQQYKSSFPILDKDAPNAWADQDASDVEFSNLAHILHAQIPNTEKWATISSVLSGKPFPWIDMYQAYNGLISWAEHTNGVYSEGPIFVPASLKDSSAANVTYYEVEQEMHRDLLRESLSSKIKVDNEMLPAFDNLLTTTSEYSLVVTNPLTCLRSDFLNFQLPEGMLIQNIIDNTTGENVLFQYKDKNTVIIFCDNIPSLGYKMYSIKFKKGKVSDLNGNFIKKDVVVDNNYYKAVFDSKTGAIASLYDKKLDRELVDKEARFKVNEYFYRVLRGDSYQDGITDNHPFEASFAVQNGPVADIVIAKVCAKGADNIIQKTIFYKNSNQIDFEISFDKCSTNRTIDDYRHYSPNGKETLFYCFPFDIDNFRIYHDSPSGVVEPVEDQFKGSNTDFYAFQSFSDISNSDWGITLATVEPNLIVYGEPRATFWCKSDDYESKMVKAEKSQFNLYLLNNTFFTNIRQDQPGFKKFKWSVKPHKGDCHAGKSYMFGRYISNPLHAHIVKGKKNGVLPSTQKAFMDVNREGVFCSTFKLAESNGEGYILRFVEVEGKSGPVAVDFHLFDKIAKVNMTNLVEEDTKHSLRILNGNSFSFYMPAYGVKTLRVVPEELSVGNIELLNVNVLSDRKIKLKWTADKTKSNNIAYYHIYRSKIEDFTPGIDTYVSTVVGTEFIDEPILRTTGWVSNNIEPETKYFYKVVPVNKFNKSGKPSSEVSCVTLSSVQKNSLPNKVLGVRATRISAISGHNYVALYFYTNIEDDVEKYEIYRGEKENFAINSLSKVGEVDVNVKINHITPHGYARITRPLKSYCSQMFIDQDVACFTKYYYCVVPVDTKGQRGIPSDKVSVKTEVAALKINGDTSFKESVEVKLENLNKESYSLRYTMDGTTPTIESKLYTDPILITKDMVLTAAMFDDNGRLLSIQSKEFKKIKNYTISYKHKYNDKWPGAGNLTLIDGHRGGLTLGELWQGFEVDDLDIIVDLKSDQIVRSVALGCLQNTGNFVFFPSYVEIEISDDGKNFTKVGRIESVKEWQRLDSKKADFNVTFTPVKCRYLRVFAKNIEGNPEWHPFPGGKSWIFVDELIIK